MSADNYIVIVRSGVCFVPVMMFASSDEPADICSSPEFKTSPRFMSLKEAVQYAESQYTEYGYRISDECWTELGGEDA
jgi:hypothetical protein